MSMTYSTHQSPNRCSRCGLHVYRSTGVFYKNGTQHVVSDGGGIFCPAYREPEETQPVYPWSGSFHDMDGNKD